MTARNWIGVASLDHVMAGVAGGFCQLHHGRRGAVARLAGGDWIAYYSPRSTMRTGTAVQAFTAIGQVCDDAPYPFDTGRGFVPYRRNVRFLDARDAPIRPLIDSMSFIRNKRSWGDVFRFGLIEIPAADFTTIAAAMNADLARADPA